MAGLGVRLVRRDNQLISLDCTDYMIQIDRNIRSISVPFTGERFGGDINQVSTSIRLNCVIRDDDCAQTSLELTSATAAIDFSQTITGFELTDDFSSIIPITRKRFMSDDGGDETKTSIVDTVITFHVLNDSGEEETLTITLQDTADSGTSAADMGVRVDNMTDSKGSELAARLKDRINSNSTFSALLTAEVKPTLRDTGSEKSRLELTNVHKGGVRGITNSPIYTASGTTKQPTIGIFSGGEAQACFSAGDKVQNLVGSVINNHVFGVIGGTSLGALGNKQFNWDANSTKSDYIVGLQLPYNSFSGSIVGDTAVSTPQSYTGKNFIYATGYGNKNKDAVSNTESSSTEFDPKSIYTGIRGTVTSLEFKYNAGDTTYDATLTFQPLDLIAGV